MGSDWEDSRSSRMDREGFQARANILSRRAHPTDEGAADMLPKDFVRRLARGILSAAKSLDQRDGTKDWSRVLTRDRAWYFSVLLSCWYLIRSQRSAQALPAARKLTDGMAFSLLFNYFDGRKELLEPAARSAYDNVRPQDSGMIAEAFKGAASRLGLTAIQSAVENDIYRKLTDGLQRQFGGPDFDEVASRPLGPSRAPAKATLALAAPSLTSKQTCVAMLLAAGHSPAEAEAICSGPQNSAAPVGRLAQVAARAKRVGRPLLVMISATWCGPCKAFKAAAQQSPAIAGALKRFVFADFDTDTSDDSARVAESLNVESYPTFIAFTGSGAEAGRLVGYRDPPSFAAWLNRMAGEPRA